MLSSDWSIFARDIIGLYPGAFRYQYRVSSSFLLAGWPHTYRHPAPRLTSCFAAPDAVVSPVSSVVGMRNAHIATRSDVVAAPLAGAVAGGTVMLVPLLCFGE